MANKDIGRTGPQQGDAGRKGGPDDLGEEPVRGDAGEDIRGVGDEEDEDAFEEADEEEDVEDEDE